MLIKQGFHNFVAMRWSGDQKLLLAMRWSIGPLAMRWSIIGHEVVGWPKVIIADQYQAAFYSTQGFPFLLTLICRSKTLWRNKLTSCVDHPFNTSALKFGSPHCYWLLTFLSSLARHDCPCWDKKKGERQKISVCACALVCAVMQVCACVHVETKGERGRIFETVFDGKAVLNSIRVYVSVCVGACVSCRTCKCVPLLAFV